MPSLPQQDMARCVVKVAAIIASADGLDLKERSDLVDFARLRSGLSQDVLLEQIAAAAGGLAAITDDDMALLRLFDRVELGRLFNDVILRIASADGQLSEGEQKALREIWSKLDQG